MGLALFPLFLRLTAACLALAAAGCAGMPSTLSSFGNTGSAAAVGEVATIPDEGDLVGNAKANFANGNYGKAADLYIRASRLRPQEAELWLGLAASYDHLRRFDQADARPIESSMRSSATAQPTSTMSATPTFFAAT